MNPEIPEPEEAAPTANAVSLYGQAGGANDFPVLKAFQEYIDAEQAKARKRMLGLSIFFIVLLVVVVVTFTLVITTVISRNQALSDRLLDIALREKAPAQPVVNVQSPAPMPVMQPSVESAELVRLREELQRQKEERQAEQAKRDKEKIESLTAALAKAQQQPVAPTPVVVNTSPVPVVQTAAESAELARLREELRREKEERKAEQARAKEEKRQADIEAHRRRLYPEYYAQQDAMKATGAVPVRVAPPPEMPAPAPAANSPVVRPSQPAPENTKRSQRLTEMKPVSYFNASEPDEDPELKELLKPKTAPQSVAKPAPQPVAKPAPKPVAKPAPQPVAKPAPQPVAKPAPQPVAKQKTQQPLTAATPAQPSAKPTRQPEVKPAPKPVQEPAQPETKTETLAIGGADGGPIPWLIELPQN